MKTSRRVSAALVLSLVICAFLAPPASAQMAGAAPFVPAEARGPSEPGPGAKVGAGLLNVVYVPGKVILCSTGTVLSAGLMLLTFGSAHRTAVDLFNQGCGGAWVLTAYDVIGRRPPEER
jgi:hypothetical protein